MLYNIIYTNTNTNVITCHTVIYLLYERTLSECIQLVEWLLEKVVTVNKYVDESHCMRNIYSVFESVVNPFVIVILTCIEVGPVHCHVQGSQDKNVRLSNKKVSA